MGADLTQFVFNSAGARPAARKRRVRSVAEAAASVAKLLKPPESQRRSKNPALFALDEHSPDD